MAAADAHDEGAAERHDSQQRALRAARFSVGAPARDRWCARTPVRDAGSRRARRAAESLMAIYFRSIASPRRL